MNASAPAPFLRFFAELTDPRRPNVRHLFSDILALAILAVMCKADDVTDIHEYACANEAWLRTFLLLPRGIPSADTFRRVLARIDPAAFERCFIAWTAGLSEISQGRLIAIDGKTLRRSFQHAWDKQGLHLVSAWCQENQLVLGQLAVEEKANEIVAIPKLLELLDLKGALVSIDAMGTQKAIAGQIRRQGADYLLALKENQPMLHAKAKALLDEAILEGFAGMRHGHDEQTRDTNNHGRIETRRVWVTDEVHWLGEDLLGQWPDLASLIVVEAKRQDLGDASGKVSVERRYFLSSCKGCDAKAAGRAVRGHWEIENKVHWVLDVSFGEDQSRIRKDHGAENVSRLRRIVLNKLRNFDTQRRVSLKTKRYRCSIDRQYLLDALQQ